LIHLPREEFVPGRKSKPPPPERQPEAHEASAKLEGKGAVTAKARQRRKMLKTVMTWGWVDELQPFLVGGRPTSRELVRAEAKCRLTAGSRPALKVLAGELSAWLVEVHPQAPPMAPSTVEDNIRDLWSAAGE
jgi:hypothetical protein